jgi:hypothetical protein
MKPSMFAPRTKFTAPFGWTLDACGLNPLHEVWLIAFARKRANNGS